ncbi:unnamed protein product [Trichobilharzia regenti]|nr:unnamed protein product [Trichobilharzia regenti]
MFTIEQLPVVEFIPEDDLSYEEVINYLQSESLSPFSDQIVNEDENNLQTNDGFSQTLKISHEPDDNNNTNSTKLNKDVFTAKLLNSDVSE